jgi:uncharacterized protein
VKRPFIVTIVAIALVILAIGALVYIIQLKDQSHTPLVDLTAGNGTLLHMNVEVADTPGEWEYGLMNRTSMPWDVGMLFIFGNDEPRYFWMDNTLIPLDMLFITKDLTIIDIHENATPMSRDVIGSSGPCRYVLEVNGGLCAAEGIDIGDRIALDIS